MNRILKFSGGADFRFGTDFEFLQDATKEALNAIGLSMSEGGDAVFLNGCATSYGEGDFSITAGFIFLKGEIYRVTAATLTGNPSAGHFYLQPALDYASTGNRIFKDSISRQIHQLRSATLHYTTGSVPSDAIDLNITSDGGTDIKYFNKNTQWFSVSLSENITGNIRFRLNKNGNVEIFADIVSTEYHMPYSFTLPIGFRPAIAQMIIVNYDDSVSCAAVGTNGIVSFGLSPNNHAYIMNQTIFLG